MIDPARTLRDALIARNIVARIKKAAGELAKGDTLEVVMKKGQWWTEMRKGALFTVKDIEGDQIRLLEKGSAMGSFTLTMKPGQDVSGKFQLTSDKLGRALTVKRV